MIGGLPSEVCFGVIADEPLRVFRIECFLIEPDSDAAFFRFTHDLVSGDIIARKLPEFIEDVVGNQMLNLFESDNHCLPPISLVRQHKVTA